MGSKKNPKRSEESTEILQQALALRDAGDWHGAEVHLTRLDREGPDDLDVLIILAGVLFHTKKWDKAAKIFQRILKARPNNEPASLGLFLCLWHLEKRKDAIREMERFLSITESQEYERLLRDLEGAVNLGREEASTGRG